MSVFISSYCENFYLEFAVRKYSLDVSSTVGEQKTWACALYIAAVWRVYICDQVADAFPLDSFNQPLPQRTAEVSEQAVLKKPPKWLRRPVGACFTVSHINVLVLRGRHMLNNLLQEICTRNFKVYHKFAQVSCINNLIQVNASFWYQFLEHVSLLLLSLIGLVYDAVTFIWPWSCNHSSRLHCNNL